MPGRSVTSSRRRFAIGRRSAGRMAIPDLSSRRSVDDRRTRPAVEPSRTPCSGRTPGGVPSVGAPVHAYDIGVRIDGADTLDERQHAEVQRAFRALLRGDVEADGLNRLVLAADLTVRQVAILRCYSRYLQQAGFPVQSELHRRGPRPARADRPRARLVDRSTFDPKSEPSPLDSSIVVNATRADIVGRLDAVPSLDDDRICRAFLTLIDATTDERVPPPYQSADDGRRRRDRRETRRSSDPVPPEPRPMFEIFVCSPKVEGVHLRAGRVARGGLRWSDRREDYRTEVLGFVKAQMVKNAVIVPVGAKGGFVVKQPTADPADRDGVRAEGIDRYQRFIRSLLDVTDNLVATTPMTAVRWAVTGRASSAMRHLRRRRSVPRRRCRQGHGHVQRHRQPGRR